MASITGGGVLPGRVGATCGGCVHGPHDGQRIWFCPYSWEIVSAIQRGCEAYDPVNGQVTEPLFRKGSTPPDHVGPVLLALAVERQMAKLG